MKRLFLIVRLGFALAAGTVAAMACVNAVYFAPASACTALSCFAPPMEMCVDPNC
jgi:hypothetical protein